MRRRVPAPATRRGYSGPVSPISTSGLPDKAEPMMHPEHQSDHFKTGVSTGDLGVKLATIVVCLSLLIGGCTTPLRQQTDEPSVAGLDIDEYLGGADGYLEGADGYLGSPFAFP